MKKIKLFTTLAVVAPIVATVPAISSCSKTSAEAQEAQEYIKDRTFSIAGVNEYGYGCFGTGWILSDATKSSYDDFEYYIATNWHVQYGIEEKLAKPLAGYYYGDTSSEFVNNYTEFDSLTWETDTDKFCFVESDKTQAIDFYVAKVKFGSDMPATIKTKLTKLNQQQKEKGYINKFGKKVSKTNNYIANTMYVGGYPLKKNASAGNTTGAWRFQEIKASANKYYDKDEFAHAIDGKTTPEIVDISPQYYYKADNIQCQYVSEDEGWVPIDSQWGLSGGSSGSMVITKDGSEWVVIGISWGGECTGDIYYGKQPVYFHPCISLFRNEYKDFTASYTK